MRIISWKTLGALSFAALAAPGLASADTYVTGTGNDLYNYSWHDSSLSSGIGVSVNVGGGVGGFTDSQMRDVTSKVNGAWNARVGIGTHIPIGIDLQYRGTAQNVDSQLGPQSSTLIGTTVEGDVRFNILPHYWWNPYAFIGVGWQRYDVTNNDFTLSDSGMNNSDNLLEVPMGIGLSYRNAAFVADLRGTFRATTFQDLVLINPSLPSTSSSDFANMDTWDVQASLGFQF